MLTLSQKLAAGLAATSLAAGAAVLSAPQAQAQTTDIPPNSAFVLPFATGLVDVFQGNFTATGNFPYIPLAPLADWRVTIDAISDSDAIFTVGRGTSAPLDTSNSPLLFAYYLTNTSGASFRNASIAIDLINGVGSATKTVFGVFQGGSMTDLPIGVATLGSAITLGGEFSTIFVVDQVSFESGSLSSVTNSFSAVPEPMTILGASAAVAFGAAFKRRKANKA
jgi:hypothetical protein